jgi:hypothetical protein
MVSAAVFFWILSSVYCTMETQCFISQLCCFPQVTGVCKCTYSVDHLGRATRSYRAVTERSTRVGALCNFFHLRTKAEPSYKIFFNLHYMKDKVYKKNVSECNTPLPKPCRIDGDRLLPLLSSLCFNVCF